MSHEIEFRSAIEAAGLTAPDDIIGDGKLHRFASDGRGAKRAGWYTLHADGVAAGAFGCWRTGMQSSWCSKSNTQMTEAERQTHRERIRVIKAQRDDEQTLRHDEARQTAKKQWVDAKPADPDHPYLRTKGVEPHGIRQAGELLLAPLRDVDGTLHSLQTIAPDGEKRFLTGGRVAGCYFAIGRPKEALIVCEGFASGASIHEATGHAVAVAFTAGNLLAVAKALRSKYPGKSLIMAADDDANTPGNPGVSKATEAAQAVGASLAIPTFPEPRGAKMTDFNDLVNLSGTEALQACIEAAIESVATHANDAGATGQPDLWPDPAPLPNALPPVRALDPELLPEALRGWIDDIAMQMQCPSDFTAIGALVALSSLIGARAVVYPKERGDWTVVPNLWGLVVGRPGVMKSPALSEVLRPLYKLEEAERKNWQEDHDAWDLDCKVADMAAEGNAKEAKKFAHKDPIRARALLESADEPPEPMERRYVVNDTSVEKLADMLISNPCGTLVYRDELHGLLCSMDRQGQEGARGFYLTAYDGNQSYRVDRIIRGSSFLPRVCLSLLGGIQPGKIQSYVREAVTGGSGDDGLLQRFSLAVWPDISQDFVNVDEWPDTPAKQAAWAVFERLSQLNGVSDTEPQAWRFSPEAQAIYREWVMPFEREIRGDDLHPALVSHLAKYRKLVPALALIFALIDTPDSGSVIHARELLRSLAWSEYLRSHAERIYAAATIPETDGAQNLLSKIRAGKLRDDDGVMDDTFTPRQIAVKHWAGLTKPDDVRKAADLLVDFGWLRHDEVKSGDVLGRGRPSDRYAIHPVLMKGGRP